MEQWKLVKEQDSKLGNIKKFGAVGCSHTSRDYGEPWPVHLSRLINAEPIIASSNGAGNYMMIDKVRSLCEQDADMMIVQLTQPTRITLGMSSYDQGGPHTDHNDKLCDGHYHNGVGYYTWGLQNEKYFKQLDYNLKIDKFWVNEVMSSNWLNLNNCHNILTSKYICDHYNIPIIFFSWFEDFHKLMPSRYDELIKTVSLIPGCVMDYVKTAQIQSLPDGHYGTESQKKIVEDWLFGRLQPMFEGFSDA